jgi:methionyl-tRNA formyltransferase
VDLVFLGTPELAVVTLEALLEAGHDVRHVVTGPDRRRGRGGATSASPVKAAALERGLSVGTEPAEVLGVGAQLGVVVAYGRLVPADVLARLPMVNLHFSLLPRWRGAAPVERAILAGDDRTGVCLMDVEEGLDTGGVHRRVEVTIDDDVTAEELRARLAELGTAMLLEALAEGLGTAEPQGEDGVTYAEKLTAEDRRLDWGAPAVQAHRVVRVGGAWTTFGDRRLKVLAARRVESGALDPRVPVGVVQDGLRVRCGDGAGLELLQVQPEGRAPMDATAWANGARPVGVRLGP